MCRLRCLVRLGLLLAVVAPSAALASCNIMTGAAYILGGQPKVAAEYKLEDRPTVVFVDDRGNVIEQNAIRTRQAIAEKVSEELMVEKLVTITIRPADALAVARRQDREGNILAIDAVGTSVGAEQVIYVEMVAFQGSPDGYTPRPMAACRVRVIDVPNRVRLFPSPEAQEPSRLVQLVSPDVSLDLYQSAAGRRQIEKSMANQLGDRIAELFYKHVPNEVGSRLNPR